MEGRRQCQRIPTVGDWSSGDPLSLKTLGLECCVLLLLQWEEPSRLPELSAAILNPLSFSPVMGSAGLSRGSGELDKSFCNQLQHFFKKVDGWVLCVS